MSGPFRENIKQLVEKLDGGVAAVLMGFDGITVDKKRRGSTIRFVLVPTPGDTRFMEISPADIASHLARGAGAKA